jgi:hypothetical protein
MDNYSRKIITHNVRKGPDKYKGVLMSINSHGSSQVLNIFIPRNICLQFIKNENDKARFHVAEGLGNEACLYLIPDPGGLIANITNVGKQIIHLNLGYLEAYKVLWPEPNVNMIRATQVRFEIMNNEIKVYCPSWLVKVNP